MSDEWQYIYGGIEIGCSTKRISIEWQTVTYISGSAAVQVMMIRKMHRISVRGKLTSPHMPASEFIRVWNRYYLETHTLVGHLIWHGTWERRKIDDNELLLMDLDVFSVSVSEYLRYRIRQHCGGAHSDVGRVY